MLPPPYVWRIEPDRAFLDWNCGNVANVQPRGEGWELSIRYQGLAVMAPCGSLNQGIRYAERWIRARGAGIPGLRWRVQSVQSPPENTAFYGKRNRQNPHKH